MLQPFKLRDNSLHGVTRITFFCRSGVVLSLESEFCVEKYLLHFCKPKAYFFFNYCIFLIFQAAPVIAFLIWPRLTKRKPSDSVLVGLRFYQAGNYE